MSRTTMLLAMITFSGCGPTVPDDSTDADFVRQAVPTLLGRKVRGSNELFGLERAVAARGREHVVDYLMQRPEFARYWSRVIADDLEVIWRSYDEQLAGQYDLSYTVSATTTQIGYCFGPEPVITSRSDRERLAHHVEGKAVEDPFDIPWTMTDLLYGAVELDNLFPIWRAYSLTLNPPTRTGAQYRGVYNSVFTSAFLDHDPQCTACHNDNWSITGAAADDRFGEHGLDLDLTMFGGTPGTGMRGSAELLTTGELVEVEGQLQVAPGVARTPERLFAAVCEGCHGAQGTTPQGGYARALNQRVPYLTNEAIAGVTRTGQGGMPPIEGLSEGERSALATWLHDQLGDQLDVYTYLQPILWTDIKTPPPPVHPDHAIRPWNIESPCGHPITALALAEPSGQPAWFAGQATVPTQLKLSEILTSGKEALAMNVDSVLDEGISEPHRLASGPTGFALQVAAEIVNDVHEEVFGARLTMSHGLHRTFDAVGRHERYLRVFLDNNWSLRALLKEMLLESGDFNRMAPNQETRLWSPYPLPMFYDSSALTNAGTGAREENANGTTDIVHRWSIRNMLGSASQTLGWPSWWVSPTSSWADVNTAWKYGLDLGPNEPGTTTWTTSSFVPWEQRVGSCAKFIPENWLEIQDPAGNRNDWIDLAVSRAKTTGLPFEDLFRMIKDRILAEPYLNAVEWNELSAMVGDHGAVLWDSTSGFDLADLNGIARAYCGALMTTPDYMLAGVNTGYDAPLIDLAPVCDPPRMGQPPEPCGWLSVCEAAIGTPGAEYLCDPQTPPDIFPVDPPKDVYYPLPNDPPPEPNPGGPNGG